MEEWELVFRGILWWRAALLRHYDDPGRLCHLVRAQDIEYALRPLSMSDPEDDVSYSILIMN